jgi:hypothetical protein
MTLLLQDVIVSAVALGALGLLVQRVIGVVTPMKKSGGCSTCASCATAAQRRNADGSRA